MKKILAILLCSTLLLSMQTAIFADDTNSAQMQRVLQIVKERIGSTDQFDEFSSSTNTDEGLTTYIFSWTCSGENYKRCSITATTNGIITRYYQSNDETKTNTDKPTINKLSEEEAAKKAQGLLDQLNPDLAGRLKISTISFTESLYRENHYFSVQRYENGIPVYGDTGNVTVTPDADAVVNFHLQYTDNLPFANISKAISLSDAKSAYTKQIGMEPVYTSHYEKDTKTAVAIYRTKSTGKYINAISGEAQSPIEIPIRYFEEASATDASNKNMAAGDKAFSEAEQKDIETVSGLLSDKDAEKCVRDISVLDIAPTYKLTNLSRYKQYGEDIYIYNLYFSTEDQEDNKSVNVSINAKTGAVLSFYKYLNEDEKDKKLSKQTMQETALSAITTLAPEHFIPDKESDYHAKESDSENNFQYVRYVNGIPYEDDSIFVSIDPVSGKLTQYSISFSNIAFPSIDNILSEEQACEKLFEQNEYQLCYVPTCSNEEQKHYDQTLLMYRFADGDYAELDANSGEEIQYNEEEVIPEYTDISGHYAENAINTLRKFGIGFTEENFNPDAVIMQKDFVALISSAFIQNQPIIINRTFDYANSYAEAEQNNVVEESEYAPDSPVTREMAAVNIIRALNLEEVADFDEIYVSKFSDVHSHIGAISILTAMKIFSGDGSNCFYPEQPLTRADAAILIYNYLSR